MKNLFTGHRHRTITCEMFQTITIRGMEHHGLIPPYLPFHFIHSGGTIKCWCVDEFSVPPHAFERSALVDSASQYADTEELQHFC